MAGISRAEREALAEVKRRFEVVGLTDEQNDTADNISKGFAKLAVELHRSLPDGRNKALVMVHLEDAALRAVRALNDEQPAPAAEDEPGETAVVKAPRRPRAPRAPKDDSAPEVAPTKRKPRKRTAPVEQPQVPLTVVADSA